MQVDPTKPTLKAPGTERLKLKSDEPLSNFAFKFNLRRYTLAQRDAQLAQSEAMLAQSNAILLREREARAWEVGEVGQCRLTLVSIKTIVGKRLWFQRLKLQYDEPLSNFAFNFNLRRFSAGGVASELMAAADAAATAATAELAGARGRI